MIVAAALDLLDGRAVQLVQGDPGTVPVSRPDPQAVADAWARAGFRRLHVIDLDAALGRGDNTPAIRAILAAAPVAVQVGGGVRTRTAAAEWIDAGADRVIVGTRAVLEPEWGLALARELPGRVVVAADVRRGEVATHGWTRGAGVSLDDLLAAYAGAPLAGVLVTDVDREGRQRGCDRDLFARAVAASTHPILAAGSISDAADLAALDEAGVAESVLGMALYTGRIALSSIRPWLARPAGAAGPDEGPLR